MKVEVTVKKKKKGVKIFGQNFCVGCLSTFNSQKSAKHVKKNFVNDFFFDKKKIFVTNFPFLTNSPKCPHPLKNQNMLSVTKVSLSQEHSHWGGQGAMLLTSVSEPNKVQLFQFQTSRILLFMGVQKLYEPEISKFLPCMQQVLDNFF